MAFAMICVHRQAVCRHHSIENFMQGVYRKAVFAKCPAEAVTGRMDFGNSVRLLTKVYIASLLHILERCLPVPDFSLAEKLGMRLPLSLPGTLFGESFCQGSEALQVWCLSCLFGYHHRWGDTAADVFSQ